MNRFGIHTVQQLRRDGHTAATLKRAVQDDALWHIRRGYYSRPHAEPQLLRAVRVGGLATAATALRIHGVWVDPRDSRLHVTVPRNAARLRDPDHELRPFTARPDVHVHWHDEERVKQRLLAFSPVVDVLTALIGATDCSTDEYVVAMIDSALNARLLPRDRLAEIAAALPERRRGLVRLVDGRSQAGGESIVRYRLQRAGYRVHSQASVRRVGSVDLVVERLEGGRVVARGVVEVDGIAFHLGAQFAEDRRRDLELTIHRLPHLRLTYDQVFDGWPACERAVAAMLAS